MRNFLVVLFVAIFGASFAQAERETTEQAKFASGYRMKGQITVSGPFVYTATNSYSTKDPQPIFSPVNKVEVTEKDGEIIATLAGLPDGHGKVGTDLIDNIRISFEGHRASGHTLRINLDLQPLMFRPGIYVDASRFPFNREVKWETKKDTQGIERLAARKSVMKNGFDLGINSSGCSAVATEITVHDVNYWDVENKLFRVDVSFKGSCQSWSGQAFEGHAKLEFESFVK